MNKLLLGLLLIVGISSFMSIAQASSTESLRGSKFILKEFHTYSTTYGIECNEKDLSAYYYQIPYYLVGGQYADYKYDRNVSPFVRFAGCSGEGDNYYSAISIDKVSLHHGTATFVIGSTKSQVVGTNLLYSFDTYEKVETKCHQETYSYWNGENVYLVCMSNKGDYFKYHKAD